VCVGFAQERRRMAFAWKTNTTPIRALNLRKFVDIVGILKFGRVTNSDCEEEDCSRLEDWSSIGITCWSSLFHMSVGTCSKRMLLTFLADGPAYWILDLMPSPEPS